VERRPRAAEDPDGAEASSEASAEPPTPDRG